MTELGPKPVDRCTGCGQEDDHPKCHVYTADPNRPWISWHKDCHANVGCETCADELSKVPGYEPGVVGDEFRGLLVAYYNHQNEMQEGGA